MKQDFIKGMKLGAKPFIYFNTLVGVLPVYYTGTIHWLLAVHVIGVYTCFFMMGLLIIKYAESKGWL